MTVFTDSVISMIAVGGFLVFVSAGFALVKLRETFAKSLKRGDDVEANYGGCRERKTITVTQASRISKKIKFKENLSS